VFRAVSEYTASGQQVICLGLEPEDIRALEDGYTIEAGLRYFDPLREIKGLSDTNLMIFHADDDTKTVLESLGDTFEEAQPVRPGGVWRYSRAAQDSPSQAASIFGDRAAGVTGH
jgi:hypothetical protein